MLAIQAASRGVEQTKKYQAIIVRTKHHQIVPCKIVDNHLAFLEWGKEFFFV